MGSVFGSILASVGALLALGSVLLLLHVSGLTGATPAAQLALVATGGFLVGVFTLGYGVGKRATH